MSDDVSSMLDQLSLGPAILVGHSMGGVVACLVAMRRPELVSAFVVEDLSPPYQQDVPAPEQYRLARL